MIIWWHRLVHHQLVHHEPVDHQPVHHEPVDAFKILDPPADMHCVGNDKHKPVDSQDNQEHILECRMLGAVADHVDCSDICRGVESQKAVVKEFFRRVEQRKRLIADEAEDAPAVTMPACANQQ